MSRSPATLQVVTVIGVTALVLAVARPRVVSRMADFEVYWIAAGRARAVQPLYRIDDGHYQFKYLPAFAVMAIPAGLVSLPVAKNLWFHLSVILLVGLISLSIGALPDRLKPPWLLTLIVVIAMGKFYGHELVLGQVNILFAVVVLLAIRAMSAGGETIAGLLLALAVVIKPYALLFAPWLLARRRIGAVAGFAAGAAAIAALPALVYGVPGAVNLHVDWWHTVTASTAPNLTNQDNVSIAGMYAKWFGDAPAARPLVIATSAALVIAAGFVILRGRGLPRPHVLEGVLLLTLVPLLSPQGWDYVFLVSTPAIVLLANYAGGLPRVLRVLAAAAVLVIGLSLYDVLGRSLYARFMAASVITVCFFLVVAALVTLRARQVA